ncbi:MAG: hypothetical protein WC872_02150 [Candidatus Absconditabacterales bacterium]
METKKVEKSVEVLFSSLQNPIKNLNEILKEKLKGAYKKCNVNGLSRDFMRLLNQSNYNAPGLCQINGKDETRKMNIEISYHWHNKTAILLFTLINVKTGKTWKKTTKVDVLENEKYINNINIWLNGGRLPWKTFKKVEKLTLQYLEEGRVI